MIRIATRKSPLAMQQAESVAQILQAAYPNLTIQVLGFTTEGDRVLTSSLSKIGGKGLFVRELEHALLNHHADVAVHSMKDMPTELTDGLMIGAISERVDPRDVLVSNHYATIEALPYGARVGTSSLRRQCQIQLLRPDLNIVPLRGNLNTRLNKLDAGEFDAIVLAAAGLLRLNLSHRIQQYLSPTQFIPSVGQGALGLECRTADIELQKLLLVLNHPTSFNCVLAERAFNQTLQGGCQAPIAAYAVQNGDTLEMTGLVGKPDGSLILRARACGHQNEALTLGATLAKQLLECGADKILRELNV